MIYKSINIGTKDTPNYLSAVLLEPEDIPEGESYNYIRDKYKPGWYDFTADLYNNVIAPFREFKDINRHLSLRTFNPATNTTTPFYPENQHKPMALCATRLQLFNTIASQLREACIKLSGNLRELKNQNNERFYLRWTQDQKFHQISETRLKEILTAIEQSDTQENTAKSNSDDEAISRVSKRKSRHWLLSTSKTLSHFKIKGYCGKDFSYDRRWNKSPTQKSIYRLYTRVYHDVIIPNALIAKSAGKRVEFSDVSAAIVFVMKNKNRAEAWKKLIGETTANDWLIKNAKQNFEFYAYDKLRDSDKLLPEKDRWTLEKYLEKTQAGKFTEENKLLRLTYSPKVKLLIDEFLKKREIGSWSYAQIMDEYHVAKATVAKFFALLKERRKAWSDWDLATFSIEG
ncbi:hypothetical protein [uncultured Fibrobacter sp.]|uniref:hypothetical protein n=1 Tax=uncultured Fibrobacter sp. TaxID=261512 RepID=UPI0025CF6FEB|nr:hypothetical protein [uncultured Fibrobacter sp.]